MQTEFITQIQKITPLQDKQLLQPTNSSDNDMFANILQTAIDDVKTSQANLDQQQYLLATSQIDDPHSVTIAAAQAQLTVDLLVQLRNGAVEAYNELMRINL